MGGVARTIHILWLPGTLLPLLAAAAETDQRDPITGPTKQ